MAIISFDRASLIEYVPEYSGNRESVEPCVVKLRFVPYARVQHYARLIAARKGTTDQARMIEMTQEVQKRQFVDNVEGVSGYYVDAVEVRDPERFYETADTDLVIEIIKAMESSCKLSEGQRKN